jgi:hypothetical protein
MAPERRCRRFALVAALPALAAIAAPKCPVCLLSYLSWAGVSFGVASFAAPVLRPLGALFGGLALLAWLYARRRRARSAIPTSQSARAPRVGADPAARQPQPPSSVDASSASCTHSP